MEEEDKRRPENIAEKCSQETLFNLIIQNRDMLEIFADDPGFSREVKIYRRKIAQYYQALRIQQKIEL